jgi:hypothetical protein
MDYPRGYIWTYVGQLWRSWRDQEEFRIHLAWHLVPLLVGGVVGGEVNLLSGLATLAIGSFLLALWDLFVRTAAHMHKDSLDKISDIERQRDGLKEDYDKRPNILARVEEYKPASFSSAMLIIENAGGRAESVSAELSFVPGQVAPILHGSRFISGIYEIPISKGGSLSAQVASIGSTSHNSVTWRFNLRDHEKERQSTVELSSGLSPVKNPSVAVKVRVICHPENQKGPIEWQIVFQGNSFRAEPLSEVLAPSTASEQSPPP